MFRSNRQRNDATRWADRQWAVPVRTSWRELVPVTVLLLFLVAGCAGFVAPTAAPTRTPILPPLHTPVQPLTGGADLSVAYIFDASVAMQAPFGATTRLDAAQRLLAGHLRRQPVDASLGLWAFGHRRHFTERAAACADVEQIAPLLPGQGVRIAEWLAGVQAQGLAPLTAALEAALSDLLAAPSRRSRVVVISSGGDSCGRDPCAAVQALAAAGVGVEVHVIALGVVDPAAASQLRCVADATGGELRQAGDEDGLRRALEEISTAIASTATPSPSPAVEVTAPTTVTTAQPTQRPPAAAATPIASLTPVATAPPVPTEAPPPGPTATPYVEVLRALNVRAGPGLNYPIIGHVQAGARLTPLASHLNRAESRVWLLICCLADNRPGWVAAELVTAPPLPLPTPATVPPSPVPTATPRPTATSPVPTATPIKEEVPTPESKPPIPTPQP